MAARCLIDNSELDLGQCLHQIEGALLYGPATGAVRQQAAQIVDYRKAYLSYVDDFENGGVESAWESKVQL
jgi:hypothetical protein